MTKNISLFQNKFSGENLFFTSDTHFFHEGIIKFCNRPFESVEEMNETLIRNWNETVPEGGMHWLIGAIDSIPLHSIWVETGALQDNNPVYFKDPIYTLVDGEDRIPLYRDLHGLPLKGLRDKLALLSLKFHLWCFRHFHQPITDLPGLKVKHPRPFSVWEYVRMLPTVIITPFLMILSLIISSAPFPAATAVTLWVALHVWPAIWPKHSSL